MDALIIGGGISGLSAGVFSTEKGYKVSLVEAKSSFGGRLSTFYNKSTNEYLDNGQHILMGCYKETLNYLKLLNTYHLLDINPNFEAIFLDKINQEKVLKFPNISFPFNSLFGIYNSNLFTGKQKSNLVFLLKEIFKNSFFENLTDLSTHKLLQNCHQDDIMIKHFWEPFCHSTFNADSTELSSILFSKTLYRIFFKNSFNSKIIIPSSNNNDIFINPSINFIKSRGGNIYSNSKCSKINFTDNKITSIELSDGKILKADQYIFSLPPQQLKKIFPLNDLFPYLDTFKSNPIINIYLWLDRPFLQKKYLFLRDMNSQVIFNKSLIWENFQKHNLLNIVISSASHLINLSKECIFNIVKNEVLNISNVNILDYLIIKEKYATPIFSVQSSHFRPIQKTYVKNLFLVGDWISTGLPATIESAIKSSKDLFYLI